MFPREEFLPPIVRYANLFYRAAQGWSQDEELEAVQARLLQNLTELKARLAWDLPLLNAFEEGPAVAERVGKTLENLESAVTQTDAESFSIVFTPTQEDFLSAMNRAGTLREELPVFTDVRIVNEILLLGTARLEGRIDNDPIRQRLPILFDWIERKELEWKTYGALFHDQQPLALTVFSALQAIRTGMGGLHLYILGEEENGLKEGIDIILKALKVIAEAEETRALTESERVEFSPDLRLERLWRGADLPNWEISSLPADLMSFYQENIKRAYGLAQRTLMPSSLLEDKVAAAEELQARFITGLETLLAQQNIPEDQLARPRRAQALADLESARRDLVGQFGDIQEIVERNRPLEAIPLYSNLVGSMVGVLNEITPDSQLHALLDTAVKSQASFMETIERTAEEIDDSDSAQQEALEKSWEALGQQGPVYEFLWEYLQNGDRLALYEAYEAVSEPFAALVAFAAPPDSETDGSVPAQMTCPFCHSEVYLDAGKCPECRRMVDFNAAETVSTVEITTEGPTQSSVIALLDQRTASLKSGEPRDAVISEWQGLAARLESLGKSATRDQVGGGVESVISSLVGRCHEVADGLSSPTFQYASIRGSLMAQFKQLEQSAKMSE